MATKSYITSLLCILQTAVFKKIYYIKATLCIYVKILSLSLSIRYLDELDLCVLAFVVCFLNNFLLNYCIFEKFLCQILCLYDSVDAIDVDKVVEYIKGLQQEDGSFAGDKWGKQD